MKDLRQEKQVVLSARMKDYFFSLGKKHCENEIVMSKIVVD